VSIINDALKKTQSEINPNELPQSSVSKRTEKPARSPLITIFVFIATIGIIVLTLLIVAPVFRTNNPFLSAPPPVTQSPISPVPTPRMAAEHKAPPPSQTILPKRNNTLLTLNGIIAADDVQMALINNEIYKVGDLVEGKKILKITENSVELAVDEGTVILETK